MELMNPSIRKLNNMVEELEERSNNSRNMNKLLDEAGLIIFSYSQAYEHKDIEEARRTTARASTIIATIKEELKY